MQGLQSVPECAVLGHRFSQGQCCGAVCSSTFLVPVYRGIYSLLRVERGQMEGLGARAVSHHLFRVLLYPPECQRNSMISATNRVPSGLFQQSKQSLTFLTYSTARTDNILIASCLQQNLAWFSAEPYVGVLVGSWDASQATALNPTRALVNHHIIPVSNYLPAQLYRLESYSRHL